jgi:hypothetical protein
MDLVFAPSEIETWPIDRLRPYARNAKMHGDDQVAKIAASMAKFGWTVPCMVADDGELIAGPTGSRITVHQSRPTKSEQG